MAPTETVPAPLAGFKRLNSTTYIYEPPTSSPSASSTDHPHLILLPTWLSAAPRHIAKYTSGYRTLYPSARILLLTTTIQHVTIHSRARERLRLAPALSLLAALPPNTKILLHSFSNGGAYTSHLLARLYYARTGTCLPMSAHILDSSPGKGRFGRMLAALSFSLPKSPAVLYYVCLVLLHLFLAAYWSVKTVTGSKNKIEVMREWLVDGKMWDRGVVRCYVFSKGDEMVMWEDVIEHSAESREKGWKAVRTEEFVGSKHCGHLLVDEGRYWRIVREVWDEGIRH